MLDEATIRRQLDQYKSRLTHIDDERKALTDIVKGLESLLRAVTEPDYVSTEPVGFPRAKNVPSSKPVGTVSMRSAVAKVMREANRPMHTREVMDRVTAMGATTTAKAPLSVVDLVLLNLGKKGKVTKTAPRTWRWTEIEPRAVSTPAHPTI